MTSAEQQSSPRRGKLRQMGATLAAFAIYSLRRFLADGCFSASGALSYTTLVSLVPLAVIAFGTLSAFPIFAQVHDELVALAFRTLVPSIGEQAAWWFRAFADWRRRPPFPIGIATARSGVATNSSRRHASADTRSPSWESPAMIDNDVRFVTRTFGFVTAVDEAVHVINSAHTEARSEAWRWPS